MVIDKGAEPREKPVYSFGSFETWIRAINLLKILKKGFIKWKLSKKV